MKTFIEAYEHFKKMKKWGQYYRFCWTPIGDTGKGIYNTVEIFDNELEYIDKNKIEILIF